MNLTKIVFLTALPLALGAACGGRAKESKHDEVSGDGDGDGDGDGPLSSSEGKEESCIAFCDEAASCAGLSVDGCAESCASSNGVSRGGQEVLTDCLSADLCSPDQSEIEGLAAFGCLLSGLEDLELSDAARKYCGSSVDAINACLGEPTEGSALGSCEDTIALASDDFLEAMNGCATQNCDLMEACLSLEVLKNIPLDDLANLEEGADLPAAVIADLLAVAVVAGQLGISEDTGSALEDSVVNFLEGEEPPTGGAGAPSR